MIRLAHSSSATYRGTSGVLRIENGNLIFINRSGVINQRNYVIQSIPLQSIRSMHVEHAKGSFLAPIAMLGIKAPVLVVIVDTLKMPGIPRHEFHVDAPEQWISAIQNELKKVAAQVVQSSQPAYVKEIVKEIVKYPCPYCNALIEVTLSRCPFCGAPQKK